MTDDEYIRYVQLIRDVRWNYKVDQYTSGVEKNVKAAFKQVEKDLKPKIEQYILETSNSPEEIKAKQKAYKKAIADPATSVSETIKEGSLNLTEPALNFYNDNLSMGGRIANFNITKLTTEQMAALVDTPVGGKLLKAWVQNSFENRIIDRMHKMMTAEMIKGSSYPKMVRQFLDEGFSMSKRDAITMTRTWTQTVNNRASRMVAHNNKDIIKNWRWSALLEPATCIACASLDGRTYQMGKGPVSPLHPRCRCIQEWQPISYKELGLDMDDIRETYRPYTVRPFKNVDEGGKRTIFEVGKHDGDFESWFLERNRTFQMKFLGPRRRELLDEGVIGFDDLVDPVTGRVRTLDELQKGAA